MPLFSVIIPLYNKVNYVAETLDSVLSQTISDFEIIIINDGSTDDSLRVVEGFNDDRIRLISIENQGVSKARNLGVAEAKSKHIAFLDADDLWIPNHLENLKGLIEDFPDAHLYCSGYHKQKSKTQKIRAQFGTIKDGFRGEVNNYFKNSLPFGVAWTSAIAVPKATFLETGGFSEDASHGEDIELWTKLALSGQVVLDNQPTATHQLHLENRTSHEHLKNKSFLDFSQFNTQESHNPDLKHYLDNNRYAIALAFRLAKDSKNYKFWKNQIDIENLNKKQKLLLKLPIGVVVILKKTQQILAEKGLYLSTFR